MNKYTELAEKMKKMGGAKDITICQGIVKSVSGNLCDVEFGKIVIPGVRLRASELDDDGEILVTPKIGTAVTVGSLSGDLTQLVVLQVDHIDTIVINGGKLGGLINIGQLTDKLNKLVDEVNSLVQSYNGHTHQGVHGTTGSPSATASDASSFDKGDYEDETVKH